MSQQLDVHGEAHDALGTAVSSYGHRVLSDPHILGNLVTDLLPDLLRERSLLVTGADAGVAAEITQHVQEQHVDPDTAVQLAARALSERRAIDPAASMWVASEYAQALGYRVRPYAAAVQSGQPQAIPAVPPTVTARPGPSMVTQPAAPVSPQLPPIPYAASMPPQEPPQSWPPPQRPAPQGPPPQSWPPPRPPSGGPPPSTNRSKRGPVIAAIAAAGAVVLYLIVATAASTFPFTKSHPAAVTPTVKPTHRTTPSPTPSPTLAPGVTPLSQLLPADIPDPTTDCQPEPKPYGWSMPGVVQALDCNDPGLPNGFVAAYQMNNRADFDTAWRNFNSSWNFDPSTAQQNCPPSTSSAQGRHDWIGPGFPSMQGQVIECQLGANAAPIYVWTMPTQDAFVIAEGANGSSFKALDTWWVNNSGPPNTPTATPSPQAS